MIKSQYDRDIIRFVDLERLDPRCLPPSPVFPCLYLFSDEGTDPEVGARAALVDKGPPTSVIIPIYRRDCHEEVIS